MLASSEAEILWMGISRISWMVLAVLSCCTSKPPAEITEMKISGRNPMKYVPLMMLCHEKMYLKIFVVVIPKDWWAGPRRSFFGYDTNYKIALSLTMYDQDTA